MKVLIEFTEPKLFAIFLKTVDGTELSKDIILKHIAHLKSLDENSKLILSGPFIDDKSGLVIVKASDKEEAILIAENDPFVIEGVRSYEVKTWQIACRENKYLG